MKWRHKQLDQNKVKGHQERRPGVRNHSAISADLAGNTEAQPGKSFRCVEVQFDAGMMLEVISDGKFASRLNYVH